MLQSVNILHVIDDEKFIPYCEETFNLQGINNKYASSGDFSKVLISSFDIIVIHYLNREKAAVLNNKDFETPIIWFFWGGDGFLLGKFSAKFLASKTKYLFLKLAFRRNIIEGIKAVRKLTFPILSDFLSYNKEIIKAFKKIDIIIPVMPGDYTLLKQKYDLKASMFHLNYVNPVLDESDITFNSGNNILLGNSASYTNNHLEIIEVLSKMNLGKRRVIIPLGYGDKKYGEYINNHAKIKLGDKVVCLLDFVPLEEYFKLIGSCTIVIMNHLRQQAVGNIIPMLAKGSNVYLQENSSLYKFLKEKGFVVSPLGEVKFVHELTIEEKLINKKLCISYFGKKTQHKKVETLLKKVLPV